MSILAVKIQLSNKASGPVTLQKRDQKTFTTQLTEAKGNADDLAKAKAAAEDKLMKLSSALEGTSPFPSCNQLPASPTSAICEAV